MAHWSPPPTSWSPASRSPGEPFAGSLRGGMPTPDLPPLGIASGLPLIPCPECGGRVVEEYIPGLGGTATGGCRRNETGVRKSCSLARFCVCIWLCALYLYVPMYGGDGTVHADPICHFRFSIPGTVCRLEEWLRFFLTRKVNNCLRIKVTCHVERNVKIL